MDSTLIRIVCAALALVLLAIIVVRRKRRAE